MKPILYTIAENKNGELISAEKAEKGNEFYCPNCKNELILRKSGKTGKGSKRPHFAHSNLTPNCTPESALHFTFKNLLAEKLIKSIKENNSMPISWLCEYCNEVHSGNLLKKIKSIKVEHNLIVCQPDIALFDNKNNIFAAIEVVVTHSPEEKTLNFYKENEIILIQINLKSDKDLANLNYKISNPNRVDVCFSPKCETCGNYKILDTMYIIKGDCWKCHSKMKVAIIRNEMEGQNAGPDEFTEQQIEFAKKKGVIIKNKFSKTVNDKYLANICSNCGALAGSFYLYTQYLSPALMGELSYETYEAGYHCNYCINQEFEEEEIYEY